MIGNEDVLTDNSADVFQFRVKRANHTLNNDTTGASANETNDDDMVGFALKFLGKKYKQGQTVTFTYNDLRQKLYADGSIDTTAYVAAKNTSAEGDYFFPNKSDIYTYSSGAWSTDTAATASIDVSSEEGLRAKLTNANGIVGAKKKFPSRELLVPLNFWFCRNPGLALPLLALQYHEVKVNVTFESFDKLWNVVKEDGIIDESVSAPTHDNLDCKFWVDYIYLDNEERTRMASDQHEYLIEQVQYTGEESCMHSTNRFKLNFNHPCKELVWVVHPSNRRLGDFEYPDVNDSNPVKSAKMTLNGHERFKERPGYYFDCVQPYEHHSRCPPNRGINVYSFALNPEEHQPSGTCNFSRIDNSLLEVKTHNESNNCSSDNYYCNAKAHIYATSVNSLRIMSGLGGLKFSN
jgi:hypothetical protein